MLEEGEWRPGLILIWRLELIKVYLNKIVLEEIREIVKSSKIMECSDDDWPVPNDIGKQEIDIRINDEEINFRTSKIGSFSEVIESKGKNEKTRRDSPFSTTWFRISRL